MSDGPIEIEPLTKAAFAPWGEVIEKDGAGLRRINDGTTDRFHALARVEVAAVGGRPIISIFAGRRRPFPLAIAMLERHPLGSQSFYPLHCADWLVVVGQVDQRGPQLRCFRARGDQGVNYAADAWHHPLLVLAPRQDFLVVDREGSGDNCEEIAFSPRSIVTEPWD